MEQKDYVKSLDGLRFFAVVLVLLDHWTNGKMGFPASYFGVSLFFVLSGFLITGILLRAKTADNLNNRDHSRSLKLFYIRRTLRIFPLYYLVLLVLYIQNEDFLRQHIFWLITYQTNNYIAYTNTWMGSFDHFWSLAVEEQFYLFFPFVIFFIRLNNIPRVLILLILSSVLLRYWFYFNHHSWVEPYVLMPTSLDALGLGGLLAYYLFNGKATEMISNKYIKIGLLISLISYCLLVIQMKSISEPHNFYSVVLLRFFESLLSVFLIFSFVKIKDKSLFAILKRAIFENKFVVFGGKISYGIYIYHHFIYNFYYSDNSNIIPQIFNKLNHYSLGFGDNIFVKLCILFPIVLIISTISWYVFENPINKLKDKYKY
ncbi:MAG: acyltransferase [Bacteroidota bacterium]